MRAVEDWRWRREEEEEELSVLGGEWCRGKIMVAPYDDPKLISKCNNWSHTIITAIFESVLLGSGVQFIASSIYRLQEEEVEEEEEEEEERRCTLGFLLQLQLMEWNVTLLLLRI